MVSTAGARPALAVDGDVSRHFLQILAATIETDADDIESLVVIRVVVLADVGHLGKARPAPGGPEIDQHDLAAVLLKNFTKTVLVK